ncbi:DedA family protein [Phenylobacterium sp. LjRoot219]|uniref:DedA family protein n=1 Tax=Phenylobacterium sp. LjRoot219 TaxID=3342283 RepID=UPI003ED15645
MFDWIVGVVVTFGLLGVLLLMFAENVVPPIPSELIMPLAGFAAAQGHFSFPAVVVAGTLGALAGATLWYWVGRAIAPERLERWVERYGRWLTIDRDDLERSRRFFLRHGGWAVFVGRLTPGVRTMVSVPAGLTHMPAAPFLAWSAAGTALWTLLLASLGYVLEARYQLVEAWLDPVSTALLVGAVAFYLARVVWFRRAR